MSVRLVGVFAHPDDDTHGIGGLLALAPEIPATLVIATSGEAGTIVDDAAATRETLAEVREREELAALAALGRPDVEVRFLRHPDGGLAEVDREQLVGEILGVLLEVRPDVVITFGPDGITLHPDHVAAGQAASEAFQRARVAGAGDDGLAFRRLYHHGIPRSRIERMFAARRAAGEEVDPEAPFMPRGVPDETVAVLVDTSSVLGRKVAALRAHRSQPSAVRDLPEEFHAEAFAQETLVQAWPPPATPVGRPAPSPFAGLEG